MEIEKKPNVLITTIGKIIHDLSDEKIYGSLGTYKSLLIEDVNDGRLVSINSIGTEDDEESPFFEVRLNRVENMRLILGG